MADKAHSQKSLSTYLTTYGIRQPSQSDRKIIAGTGHVALYFVGFEEDEPGSPIKIGIADGPYARFNSLQCGNWRTLKCHQILWVKGRPPASAYRAMLNSSGMVVGRFYERHGEDWAPIRDIEAAVHAALINEDDAHHAGEWFTCTVERAVECAKDIIKNKFGREYLDHNAMLRRVKMWKIEAEAAPPPPRQREQQRRKQAA